MNFDHTIDGLRRDIDLLIENVAEWERDSDPHAINKPRAEFARARIAEKEAAVALLESAQESDVRSQGSDPKGGQ